MVDIDWGDLTPTRGQRARALAQVQALSHFQGPIVALRRRGSGFEARLTTPLPAAPAEVRLTGDDLGSVIDRACQFLSFVAREERRRA